MSQHDDLTSTLSRELAERAETMDGSLLHLADVQGRARSIRRRRTTTAVAGVAAAVAVIIPTVSLATHTSGKPEPGPAITHTPSPGRTASDDGHQPAPGVLDVSDLPTGDAPGMEYVTDGKVLHEVDGSTVDIGTRHPVSSFGVLADGTHVYVTADQEGNPYVEIQDAEGGNLQAPVPASWSGLAVSRTHDAAAWIDPHGQVMLWSRGATEPRPLGQPVTAGTDLRMGAFESENCIKNYCTVFVNVRGGTSPGQPWEVSDYATRPFTDGDMLSVADAAAVVIGWTRVTESGSCSVLWGGGEFQGFDTCKATLESLSPDSSTVLGYPPYYDGLGPTSISMWGLHGKRLFERQSTAEAQAFYTGAEWEDNSHVLAPVFQEGTWSVVRIGSDGSMEYAVTPIAGKDLETPYVLPSGGSVLGG